MVTSEYFMDKMQPWEVAEFANVIEYNNAAGWEQARSIMYMIAQVNSKKKLSIKDIIKLPWDSEGGKSNIEITNEEIEMLKKKAEARIKWMKEQKQTDN
jgi:hypothetical protein